MGSYQQGAASMQSQQRERWGCLVITTLIWVSMMDEHMQTERLAMTTLTRIPLACTDGSLANIMIQVGGVWVEATVLWRYGGCGQVHW